MKKISLTKGKYALVDNEDYIWLSEWKWHCGGDGYAVRTQYVSFKKTEKIRMHRLIMNASGGLQIDHIDGDVLNNCKSNLRECTAKQNSRKKKKKGGKSSVYKGVSWKETNNKWQAAICVDYHTHYLGIYSTELEAASAYNKAALKYFKTFAKINEVAA